MICSKCNTKGVLNTVLNKEFYYCRTCKDEISLGRKPTSAMELAEDGLRRAIDKWTGGIASRLAPLSSRDLTLLISYVDVARQVVYLRDTSGKSPYIYTFEVSFTEYNMVMGYVPTGVEVNTTLIGVSFPSIDKDLSYWASVNVSQSGPLGLAPVSAAAQSACIAAGGHAWGPVYITSQGRSQQCQSCGTTQNSANVPVI